jgi:hypothetical protein
MEYFKDKKIINTNSTFEKEDYKLYKMILDYKLYKMILDYKLYKMILDNKSENEILTQVEFMKTLPISYFELRTFFG